MRIVGTVAIAHLLTLSLAAYAHAHAHAASSSQQTFSSSTSGALAAFHWGGTLSAIFLLILNQVGRRSSIQSSLLILFLLTSFPAVLLKIVRGQIGRWFAFLSVAANLSFPEKFPVAGFILLVAAPDWLADGLRDGMFGGVFCLLLGLCLVITEIRGIGVRSRCEWKQVATLYEGENRQLPDVFVAVLHEGDEKEMLRGFIDPSLSGNYPLALSIVMIRLIHGCLKKAPASRPDMVEIRQSLVKNLDRFTGLGFV